MSDSSYSPKTYRKQGGDEFVVASGGLVTVESGGIVAVESGGDITVNGVSLIDEVAALSGLDSGELGVLNGVTAGTVTLSKAVVVDANKDIGDFRNLDAVNFDAGASGTAGTVDVFPTTALKGKLILSAVANDGDTNVTITNAAMGQASVISIPDPGAATANVLLTSAANDLSVVTATATELNYNDIATLGAGAASKAVVLDAGEDFTWPATGVLTYGVLKDPAATTLDATALELNRAADVSSRIVNCAASTLAVTEAAHDGRTIVLDLAGGIAVTLPTAAAGLKFEFIVKTTFTGASSIKSVVGTDIMIGHAIMGNNADNTVVNWQATAADTFDTIDLLGTTNSTGGMAGQRIRISGLAAALWYVEIIGDAAGTEATPFQNTVA